jgi:DNA-binding NarL/FixJ family response regulator
MALPLLPNSENDWRQMEPRIALTLFSKHTDILRSLQALLSRMPDFNILSATPDPIQLIQDAAKLHPHIALIDDFRVPDLSELCRQVVDASSDTKLAILQSPISAISRPLPSDLHHFSLQKPVRGIDLASQIRAYARPDFNG